jgi:hypothetical protein
MCTCRLRAECTSCTCADLGPSRVWSVYFMMSTDCENATDVATDPKAEIKPTSETGHTGGLPTSVPCRQCRYRRRCQQVPTGTHRCRHVPTGFAGAEGCATRYPACRAAASVPNLQFRDIPKFLPSGPSAPGSPSAPPPSFSSESNTMGWLSGKIEGARPRRGPDPPEAAPSVPASAVGLAALGGIRLHLPNSAAGSWLSTKEASSAAFFGLPGFLYSTAASLAAALAFFASTSASCLRTCSLLAFR